MQLSSNARKAVATGLAISTLLWTGLAGVAPLVASAAVHSDGCVVLSGGVVWLITGGTRRGFTSAEVFQSSGYNFSQVVAATTEDVSLPVGPIMTYADGTLVKGPNDPLVYLVAGGQKRGFTTGSVFTGLGYSFANIQMAPVNTFQDLPTGSNLDSTTISHPAGTLVISNGAIWWMSASGRMGFPSMAVFNSYGLMLSHAVSANSYDLALPDQGAVMMRAGCTGGGGTTPPPSGSVSVSLASDNPGANTVVAGQSTADLAHFVFSGSGAVTQLTLQRLGVSANDTLSNVYLYNGNLRITDSSSVNSSGQITFSNSTGLFNAPASISVRADIKSGASGQTVGIGVVSGMSGSAAISGNPQGNLFTVANPGNLATAVFGATATPSSATGVNAGSLNYSVWSDSMVIGNRSVWLKTAMFRVIGSAPSDALQNWVLYVDGTQVATASALNTINGSNYAVFTPGSPYSVNTGSHTLEVRADVVKGSGRTATVSLQNAADIMLTDSSFNVNVTPETTSHGTPFASTSAAELTVSIGLVSVQLDPTFNSISTVAGGATNVPLAKFNLTAYGEDVQINTLKVTLSDASTTALDAGLNNVALYANGSQVGSTQQIATSGTTATFTLGSSLIIPAGGTTHLSVQADTIDSNNANITSGTLQVSLVAATPNVNNGQGRTSQDSSIDVPTATVTANTMTVGAGGLTVAKNGGYTDQTLSPNSIAQKIGSFTLQAGTSEGIRISNFAVSMYRDDTGTTAVDNTASSTNYPALTNFSNVKVSVNGGTPSTPQAAQSTNNFSQNFTIPVSTTATVDVWADLGADSTGSQFRVTLLPTATGAVSNTSATPGGVIVGQVITLAAGSLVTPVVFTTASSSAAQFIAAAGGATDGSHNSFNLSASNGAITVTELKFAVKTVGANSTGAVSSVKVGNVSAPVITPAPTAIAASGTTLNNTTDPVTFNVLTSANMQVGSILTIQNEDLVVTAIVSPTSVTARRGANGTTPATHADSTAITIQGLAYLTNLSIAVPNGSGGVYIDALPTYTSVGTNGIQSGSTAQLTLSYTKYNSGSSSPAAALNVPAFANTMNLVGSNPTLSVTSTNNAGLTIGENHALDLTITPNSKGNVQINTLVFNVTTSSTGNTLLFADGASNSVARLAVGSTTITGSSCANVSKVVTCTLPTGYVLTAGTPQTLTLYVTTSGTAPVNSSLTTALAAANSAFSWTDVAGGGSAVTGSTNGTYFLNYPTQTWSLHN